MSGSNIVRVDVDELMDKEAKLDIAKRELEDLKRTYGLKEPDRGSTMNDDGIKWREKAPDYTIANLAYLKGKTMNHAEGSLEELVENVVKTWEFESSHKLDLSQWTTINKDKYTVSCNGGPIVKGEDAKNKGNYGWLLGGCPARLWDPEKMNFEASHHLFRTAFDKGFAWEVTAVFSGPPVILFSWRHWATFGGVYKCPVTGVENQGDGALIELFGLGRVTLDENSKVCGIEIFYKPDEFLEVMKGERDPSDLRKCNGLVGPMGYCTVLSQMEKAEGTCFMKCSIPCSWLLIGFFLTLSLAFAYLYFAK